VRGGLRDGAPSGAPLGGGPPRPPCSAGPRNFHFSTSVRAASICSLSSSPIYIAVPHQVGCGCAANVVFHFSGVFDFCFKCFICMLQKVDLDVAYVFKCFKHFRHLFQAFHLVVVKVDLDVAYLAMTKYACWKSMCQVFQVFHTYVTNVSSGCFKSRSWCCTCCKWIYMYISIACFKCFICLRRMLQMFRLDVSKSRSGVAHVAIAPMARGQRLVVGLRLLPRAFLARHDSPSPLLSLLSLPFPHQSRCGSSSSADERMNIE
jgi:hypothetical protein